MQFVIKEVPALILLSAHRELTIPEIPAFAGEVLPLVCQKAAELKLEQSGPDTFLYVFDCESDRLDLDIGVPVKQAAGNPEPYEFLDAPPLKCVSCIYKGSMKGIGKAWDELVHYVQEKGYTVTNDNREVYLKWVDFESPENETELQQGIQ